MEKGFLGAGKKIHDLISKQHGRMSYFSSGKSLKNKKRRRHPSSSGVHDAQNTVSLSIVLARSWLRYYWCANTDHGSKGNGPGGMVVDGNEVDEERHAADERGHEEGTHHHLLDPHLAC